MANSNFVVHNGLSVGPTTIDATSGNITIPVGRHITIGNVMLRDNGQGRLAIRDITDNADAVVDATLDSGSQTLGNIQIGTNHIESIDANGPVSIRPNGSGNIALAANTVMLGKGGAFTLIGTGIQTDAAFGINYTPSNIIVQTDGALSSGNIRVSMTTPSTSTATGAFQVIGGVGVRGNLNVGSLATPGALHTIVGNVDVTGAGTEYFNIGGNILAVQASFGSINSTGLINTTGNIICASISAGTYVGLSSQRINQDASNVIVTSSFVNVAVNGSNIASFKSDAFIPTTSNATTLGSTTNWWSKSFTVAATAQYADLAENYLGDASYAAGTVVEFGGANEITVCDTDMSPRVAGVVSTNPAYLMNGTQTGENIVAVALTGRVPTKVRGPILKGDLIVSAGDGHARAETLPQVGTVIGKALEDFNGDAGVIEVVVGKH